jgi:hypothetical protein
VSGRCQVGGGPQAVRACPATLMPQPSAGQIGQCGGEVGWDGGVALRLVGRLPPSVGLGGGSLCEPGGPHPPGSGSVPPPWPR